MNFFKLKKEDVFGGVKDAVSVMFNKKVDDERAIRGLFIFLTLALLIIVPFQMTTSTFAEEQTQQVAENAEDDGSKYQKKCGMTEISCHFDNLIINFTHTTNQVFEGMLNMFVMNPNQIVNNSTVQLFFNNFSNLTFLLLTVFFLFRMVQGTQYIAMENDATIVKETIRKSIVAVVVAGTMTSWFTVSLRMTGWIVQWLTSMRDDSQNGIAHLLLMGPGGAFALLVLSYAILLVIIAFQYAVRWAELAFMYAVLPLAIPSILNDEFNFFNPWLKNFVAILLTQMVQTLLIAMMFRLQSSAELFNIRNMESFADNFLPLIFSLGFAWVTMKSPSMIREMVYSTGVSSSMRTGASRGISFAMRYMMMRR
jgi:hypothetical protein